MVYSKRFDQQKADLPWVLDARESHGKETLKHPAEYCITRKIDAGGIKESQNEKDV